MPVPVHGEREAETRVLRGLRLALELSLVVLVIEAVGAYFSHSLSVTVDAVHNVPDLFAFAMSWAALQATERGTSGEFTFGPHRLEVFAGLLNAALVLGTGLVFGLVSILALRTGRRSRIPFAPSLAVGAVMAILFGNPLVHLVFHQAP